MAGTPIGPPVTFTAPQAVAVGAPFLVRFSSSEKLDAVQITWGNQQVTPAITDAAGTRQALAILGTGMNAKSGMATLIVRANSAGELRTYRKRIKIVPKKFPREELSVAPRMNNPPAKVLKRIKRELAAMKKALRTASSERKWTVPFHRPVEGVMLSRFGLRRTFNKETKRRHTGLDFRAPLGTDIAAIAAGKVILVGNYYLPGNTVVIDHGNGVVSMSLHLSEVLVSQGDRVQRGQVFGRSGATGRVTGAHLHLSVSVQGTAVDPAALFDMGALTGAAAAPRSK
ncbi:MAG: M23 family metallopeptidase [Desulfobacterales bacterium]|nr:M23 family metallopeptidase [Desulfobacterales bacterium]